MTLGEVKKSHQVMLRRWLEIQSVLGRKEVVLCFFFLPFVCFKGHRVRLNFEGPSAYWISMISVLKNSIYCVLTF